LPNILPPTANGARRSRVLEKFAGWLVENDLTDAQTDRRIVHLLEKLREDRLHVAFVAEFSRGKSELINAIFFAGYGNRILPSTAGRTTMCPTELMFDKSRAPSIELLPIESANPTPASANTSALPTSGRRPDRHRSAEAMQDALRHVSDVIRVDRETAATRVFDRRWRFGGLSRRRMAKWRSRAGATR
jgi:hypothetical protein